VDFNLSSPCLKEWLNYFNPPEADKGLIPRPLGRLRWFPIDTPLLAAGKFIENMI